MGISQQPSLALSLPEETYVSVSAECLEILLAFCIAHGNVNSILDCLHILLGNHTHMCIHTCALLNIEGDLISIQTIRIWS